MSMSAISGMRTFFGDMEKDLKGLSSKDKSVEEKAKAAVSTVVKDVKAWASTSSGKPEMASVTKDLSKSGSSSVMQDLSKLESLGTFSASSLAMLISSQSDHSRLSGDPVPAAED